MGRRKQQQPGEAGSEASRWRRPARALTALAASVLAVVAAVAIYSAAAGPPWGGDGSGASGPLTAAIVDQLSLTAPGPEFAETATQTLEDAGYKVDYFPGEEVTVSFYRSLPLRGYDLLILRAHSARLQQEWDGGTVDEVILFTNEPYSDRKHRDEQEAGQLSIARYYEDSTDRYFGIAPDFIRSSMKGEFEGTTIILMGCEGLGSEKTADAFVQKGADSIISWSGLVSASHTDAATEELLAQLVEEKLNPPDAVARTMAEVGPDPSYGSELLYVQSQ